jgi:hypothetical protein
VLFDEIGSISSFLCGIPGSRKEFHNKILDLARRAYGFVGDYEEG